MIKKLAEAINETGGRLYYVGGFVRDTLMGKNPTDIDLMIQGLSIEIGLFTLEDFSEKPVIQVVGNAPVFLVVLGNESIEVAFARKELQTGNNKHTFEFVADEYVTVFEDLERRDFTINAMAQNILTGEIIDSFGGQEDIKNGILRHVSDHFVESPERVLRLASFAARFDFDIAPETVAICWEMSCNTIPKEQIWRHFEKMCKKAIKPSRWLEVLKLTYWSRFFPEIDDLIDLEQDFEWHPEGDVFEHTKYVTDAMLEIAGNDVTMLLAAICHDMGKATATIIEDSRIKSPGHSHEIHIYESFLDKICTPNKIKEKVIELCKFHMYHIGVTVTKRFVRRLTSKLEYITLEELSLLVLADHSGRPPLPKEMPENMWKILHIAQEIGEEFKPIMQGRHLIELGMQPGKYFGNILRQCKEAQIEGVVIDVESGIRFIKGLDL